MPLYTCMYWVAPTPNTPTPPPKGVETFLVGGFPKTCLSNQPALGISTSLVCVQCALHRMQWARCRLCALYCALCTQLAPRMLCTALHAHSALCVQVVLVLLQGKEGSKAGYDGPKYLLRCP